MRNFFGNPGITATSANHIANMAKEYYETIEQEIANISLYNTDITLLTTGVNVPTSYGVKDLSGVKDKITEIADCKTLIAYLREAIKEKDNLSRNIKYPEDLELPTCPDALPTISKEDILATWPIDKLLRYYKLQTYASTFGEEVHPSGDFARARDDYHKILTKPNSVALNGQDTIITTYTPSIKKDVVETLYFDLQAEQRKYQAEFNGLDKELSDAVSSENTKRQDEYAKVYNDYMDNKKYIRSLREKYLMEKQEEIKNLKIVIPENLKPIFDKINNLSKK